MSSVPTGIEPKWFNIVKRVPGNRGRWRAEHEASNRARLEFYVEHGVAMELGEATRAAPLVHPPWSPWETCLGDDLRLYAAFREADLQDSVESGEAWDNGALHAAFRAGSLSTYIDLHAHAQFAKRFPGRALKLMPMSVVTDAALGILGGESERSKQLASLLVEAHRREFFFDRGLRPIYSFMLRLCAASVGMEDPVPRGEECEPALLDLFQHWTTPDPTAMGGLCLAACDLHTRRSTVSRKHFHEFENGDWVTLPIELLLLFKLRQRLGLANPSIDHPLAEGLRAALPTEASAPDDPLLTAVIARMRADGFAENVIAAEVLSPA